LLPKELPGIQASDSVHVTRDSGSHEDEKWRL
jgi:hypothetical protein